MSRAAAVAEPAPGALSAAAPVRLASIDVLRGLTILVMIFVNDVAGVRDTPGWMKHIEPPNADGMTFVDVVFPAFLFIVGLSIPLALGRRMLRESRVSVLRHVLGRTIGLLIIGVFMVNAGSASPDGVLPKHVWTLLMYAGVALVWLDYGSRGAERGQAHRIMRYAGVVLLLAAAVLYRGPGEDRLVELRTSWWGILGLIGWAYLVATTVYLAVRGRLALIGAGVVLLYGVFMLDAAGWLPDVPLVSVGSMLGSHAALTLSGAFAAAAMLEPRSPFTTHRRRVLFALGYGAVMALAAVLLHTGRDVHPMFIINKIAATPAWCLWSAAITIWLWALIYLLLDVRPRPLKLPLLQHAGQNALLAYILAPVFYSLVALTATATGLPNQYAQLGTSFSTGFVRSVLFALFVIWVAAVLRRRSLTLRL